MSRLTTASPADAPSPRPGTVDGPVLAVEHLGIAFHQYERGLGRRTVTPVSDMSLDVRAREVVAVVGASGAGKSLIGLAVLGLLPPNAQESGVVAVHGRPLTAPERRALAGRELTLLPQAGSFLDPLARVGAQLRRAAQLAGLPDPTGVVREVLERRGLAASTARLYPHQLSGGMTRRILFGIATLARPAVVFADEPTPGLHPAAVADLMAGIRELADAGAAVILVSHDIDQALTIADRVVVCRAGRTVEEALPEQFTGDGRTLRHPYSRALLQALPGHGFQAPADPRIAAGVPG